MNKENGDIAGCLYRTTDYTWAACEAYYGPCDAGEAWRSRITSAQLGSIMIRTVDGRRTSGNYKCFLCINRHFIDIWFFDFRYGNLVGPACGGGNVRTVRPVSSDVARNGARRRDTRLKRGPSRASRDACKLGTAQMQMAAFLFNGWKGFFLSPSNWNNRKTTMSGEGHLICFPRKFRCGINNFAIITLSLYMRMIDHDDAPSFNYLILDCIPLYSTLFRLLAFMNC